MKKNSVERREAHSEDENGRKSKNKYLCMLLDQPTVEVCTLDVYLSSRYIMVYTCLNHALYFSTSISTLILCREDVCWLFHIPKIAEKKPHCKHFTFKFKKTFEL